MNAAAKGASIDSGLNARDVACVQVHPTRHVSLMTLMQRSKSWQRLYAQVIGPVRILLVQAPDSMSLMRTLVPTCLMTQYPFLGLQRYCEALVVLAWIGR